jgi:hypothetical protein
MSWSTTSPDQPGWYWVQNDQITTPAIVQVTQIGYGTSTIQPALVVSNWSLDGKEQWQGPLQPN